jgi:HD-like signal output (HDOD) protein
VLSWLRELLWPGSTSTRTAISTRPAASAGTATSTGTTSSTAAGTLAGPGARAPAEPASDDPFLPFALALGVEPPQDPPPVPPEERAEDARVAALVRERFAASRPEPSSFPAVALQILSLAADPQADAQALARLVARDPALSAGVLSVANSPVYRGAMEVETIREAVARLGLDELGKVAAAVSARTLFSPQQRAVQAASGARFGELFGRAVAVGSAAAAFALRTPGARADRVYLGGLLHDVGKSLALRALAGLVLDGTLAAPAPQRLERVLDELHVELGGEAHQLWALPHYLTVLCVRHHDDAIPADPDFVDLHLVRLASALADLREPLFAARAARELAQSAAALGQGPFAVRVLATELREAEARSGRAFSPPAPSRR